MAVSIWEVLKSLKQGGYIVSSTATNGVTKYTLCGPKNEHGWHSQNGSVSSAMFRNLYQTGLLMEKSQSTDKYKTIHIYYFMDAKLPEEQEIHN